ncbi:farnesyltransferase beta subunit [Novymonas esmeraldas]|uniref:Farnesyltransferase beta subunit n=1 Tax=Novymonas esmeraldas TaxID=1808958 RepID=A0AAW0EKX9_9TRYP
MNVPPATTTTEAQRDTELLLLEMLRSTNPHVYALWCRHPAMEHDTSSASTDSSAGSDDDDDGVDAAANMSSSRNSTAAAAAAAAAAEARAMVPLAYTPPCLHRDRHIHFLMENLGTSPQSMSSLYPSRPWIVYWALQAADVLGAVDTHILRRTPPAALIDFLHSCLSVDHTCQAEAQQRLSATAASTDANGVADGDARPVMGFAGGAAHQEPHIASSYAACSALAILSEHAGGAALRQLPRAAIKRWLLTLRNEDGSFRVHGGGESDIRGSYCAAVITTLLGLDDPATFDDDKRGPREVCDDVRDVPVLTAQTARFVASCQTHEGGFACSATASEAHGAYTQCGLAALLLMKQPHMVHRAPLRRWLAARQLQCEGGFNGRTNKLVDSCYSHWIGASHVLLRTVEAYTKCFTAAPDTHTGDAVGATHDGNRNSSSSSSSGAEERTLTASASSLCAREVLLLDHAQLVDATLIHAGANDAWDRAEGEHLTRRDVLQQFLGADDAALRAARAKDDAKATLYTRLLQSEQTAAGADGGAVEEWRTRQAFADADVGDFYFNQRRLQDYVLRCCQDADTGGLMDKPGVAHDGYHTCYSLSGMSAAQNLHYCARTPNTADPDSYIARAYSRSYLPQPRLGGVVLNAPGDSAAVQSMMLRTTSPIFNIHQSRVLAALRVWGARSFV